jgi:hypothetical protein
MTSDYMIIRVSVSGVPNVVTASEELVRKWAEEEMLSYKMFANIFFFVQAADV